MSDRSDYTLAELKELLGPPSEFLLNHRNRRYLSLWALAIGIPPVEVYGLTPVALSNLYHERGDEPSPEATELQKIAADIFIKTVQALQSNKVDPEWLRTIVRDELEHLAPRRIEIVTPNSITPLDGPIHYITETVIKIAAIGHPIMLVGPAGCGKTTVGEHTASALQLPFYITSTINETHELTGFIDGHGVYHTTPFHDAYSNGGIWLADEIDAWDASALLAANSALANGYCVFPNSTVPVQRHRDFRMIATANTFGHGADRIYIGRNELDAASLDRFATINVDYDLTLEQMFSNGNQEWLERVWAIRKAVQENKIRHVVSSRAIIMGSRALSIGISQEDVEEIYLFKGMSSKDRDKIK